MARPVAVTRDRDEVRAGVRAMAPMLLALAPFGLLVGAAVAASDNPTAALLSTWTIYGGAAHLAVLGVLHQGAGVLGATLVGLVINARLLAYSASLAPHWRRASMRSRIVAAALMVDPTWALAHSRPGDSASVRRFYFGAGLTLWFGWPVVVVLGVFLGGSVQGFPVATLLPSLTLAALVVPQMRNRPGLAAGAAASAVAVATAGLDTGLALGLAAAAGASAGFIVQRRTS